jgi:hypothetical protein
MKRAGASFPACETLPPPFAQPGTSGLSIAGSGMRDEPLPINFLVDR